MSPNESGKNLDNEIHRIHAEIEYTNILARTLWTTGQVDLNSVPIQIHSSYRERWINEQNTYSQFEATCALLFSCVQKAIPLFLLFPDLHISFQEKENQVRIWGKIFSITNDMLYDSKSKSVLISSKSSIWTDDFFHEYGHHIHEFFKSDDNQILLSQQNWMVEENGILRPATLVDLAIQIAADDLCIDDVPSWKFFDKYGDPGKKYRHSNPREMVAETFTDNYENILSLVRNSPNINRADIISHILKNC